jgi:hypothetical protein
MPGSAIPSYSVGMVPVGIIFSRPCTAIHNGARHKFFLTDSLKSNPLSSGKKKKNL